MPRAISPGDSTAFATEFGGYLSRDSLECLHIMDGSMDRAITNLAPNKPVPNGNIGAGTPVINAGGWLETTGSDYIEICPSDSPNQTIYSLIKTPDTLADDAHRPTFWANGLNLPVTGESGNSFGNRLVITAATADRFGAGFGNSLSDDATITTTVSATQASWHLVVGKIYASGPNQGVTFKNWTSGASATPATTALPRYPVIGKTRIGSTNLQNQLGIAHHKWYMKYSKITTDEEDARNVAQIREYQLKRWGLTGF